MIDYSQVCDADAWESFCRDYLIALGHSVSIPPGRGPDAGKDMLVTEQLSGALAKRKFIWLVSCKHYATSGKSVGLEDETNIMDRLAQHGAHGFIGFYSTLASSALITRLKELRDQQKLEAFELFDAARIENGFHGSGLSRVLLQHLPTAHTSLRPIHILYDQYHPIACDHCGKYLIRESLRHEQASVVILAKKVDIVERVYYACKGKCDQAISSALHADGLADPWNDLEDFFNPLIFMRRVIGHIKRMRLNPSEFSENAHEQMLDLLIAASQLTLRQTTDEDRQHFRNDYAAEMFLHPDP